MGVKLGISLPSSCATPEMIGVEAENGAGMAWSHWSRSSKEESSSKFRHSRVRSRICWSLSSSARWALKGHERKSSSTIPDVSVGLAVAILMLMKNGHHTITNAIQRSLGPQLRSYPKMISLTITKAIQRSLRPQLRSYPKMTSHGTSLCISTKAVSLEAHKMQQLTHWVEYWQSSTRKK